ncbi:phosphatase PAP2 family protein [Stappia sp. ES.058]|uniref:phosphatase PAP2 family protein n=1 Tax=Stappia sp. ES.058 TaxID=1881061 RepID=UPI000879C72A|nr:phosphatase PAP2 family protein [Stappia sp. ES.058]SDU19856.1 PAP2 superfamily protein [Stappia sp. ES.058]
MALLPAERVVATCIGAIYLADAVLVAVRGAAIDWAGYAPLVSVGLGLLALGLFYRIRQRDRNIALAGVTAGLFILFTISVSVFNYLLLPVGPRRIDGLLMHIDGLMGYSWPDLVMAMSTMPTFGRALGFVYMSSLFQFVLLILTLGLSGRAAALHRFLLTGVLAVSLSILFWFAFPSSGPSAYFEIPADVISRLGMVVGPAYGEELNRLALDGVSLISPRDVLGLVAFPSVHLVMALMAVWFSYSVRPLFVLLALINLPMPLAVLLHGGHHLVDLFGGLAVFALSVALSGRLLAGPVPATDAGRMPLGQTTG